jgi:hypothetical protein
MPCPEVMVIGSQACGMSIPAVIILPGITIPGKNMGGLGEHWIESFEEQKVCIK